MKCLLLAWVQNVHSFDTTLLLRFFHNIFTTVRWLPRTWLVYFTVLKDKTGFRPKIHTNVTGKCSPPMHLAKILYLKIIFWYNTTEEIALSVSWSNESESGVKYEDNLNNCMFISRHSNYNDYTYSYNSIQTFTDLRILKEGETGILIK